MSNLANGQLAASATSMLGTQAGSPSSGRHAVNVLLFNTSGSLTETVQLTVTVNGGTARTVAYASLAPYEKLYLSNLPLDPADALLGTTTDATTVDYIVSEASGGLPTVVTIDVYGAIKQVNSGTSGNQAIGGTLTVTSTSASAFTVGRVGATNPVLKVNANTASVATGLAITGAAAASGLALAVISSGAAENLTLDALGTGTIGIGTVSTGAITLGAATTVSGNLTVSTKNIVTDTSTGTKIGTATTQKLSFFNATPVVQPAANTDTTTSAAGATTSVYLNTTFTGAGTAAYTIGGVIAALKALGLLAT